MNIAYVNLRVGNLEKSIQFYQDILGMQLQRTVDNDEYRYSLAWLGFSKLGEGTGSGVELTYNWDTSQYELGNGFGQIVLAVDDVYATADQIKQRGWSLTREAGPVKGGTSVIAFLEDPDGYRIELIQPIKPDSSF